MWASGVKNSAMRTATLIGSFSLAAIAVVAVACGAADRSSFADDEDAAAGPGPGGGVLGQADSGGGPVGCKNLQCKQVVCANGGKTTITGTVVAPTPAAYGKADPIYNAILYVPNGTPAAFPTGASCDKCGAMASGEPLITAISGADGKFTLENVPVGTDIPLVIQVGRWRRQVKIPKVESCTNTALDTELTRLPRSKAEGDIPLMAIVTSPYDPTECIMRKIGIADEEFTVPSGNGRVHIYKGGGAGLVGQTPPSGESLWGATSELQRYDLVALPCSSQPTTAPHRENIEAYANGGGRVFITDLSQDVIKDGPAAWAQTAKWNALGSYANPAHIDTTFPKGEALAKWLQTIGATTKQGELALQNTYVRLTDVNAPAQKWITSSTSTQTYSFNTPVGEDAENQCGRVFYSSFHIATGGGGTFPTSCNNAPLTPQEKALEFMLFDLSSCIQKDDQPPAPPPVN